MVDVVTQPLVTASKSCCFWWSLVNLLDLNRLFAPVYNLVMHVSESSFDITGLLKHSKFVLCGSKSLIERYNRDTHRSRKTT